VTDDLTKNPPQLDGFEGYEDEVSGRLIQGTHIKFTNEAMWVTKAGEEIPADLELVVVDILRVVQKWKDKRPVEGETRILAPGEKFPDIKAMNEAAPREEWGEGPDGKPRGPWQAQKIVYLLNLTTMDRYSFPTGTTGGMIAISDLVEKTKMCRRFRGTNVFPVVTLGDTFMPTRFGGRQRPDLIVKRWVVLGPKEDVLPAPTAAALPAPDSPPDVKPEDGVRTVEPPSPKEEVQDDIPSDGSAGKSDHKGSRAPQGGTTTKKKAAGSRA
jgi:hypothetical protein